MPFYRVKEMGRTVLMTTFPCWYLAWGINDTVTSMFLVEINFHVATVYMSLGWYYCSLPKWHCIETLGTTYRRVGNFESRGPIFAVVTDNRLIMRIKPVKQAQLYSTQWVYLWKLNPQNDNDYPSVKIESLESFPLVYSSYRMIMLLHEAFA